MSRVEVTDYSANPSARTVTLTGLSAVVKEQIMSIRNVTTGETLYLASDAKSASLSGKVLTLPANQYNRWSPSDSLKISYETDPVSLGIVGPPATNAGTTQTLVNNIRAVLIDKGVVQ